MIQSNPIKSNQIQRLKGPNKEAYLNISVGERHARPSHKHCIPCAKHAHAPWPRARTRLRDFHLVEFSHQPVPAQLNNELKQQCVGAGVTVTKPQERQITSCRARAGQHARLSHKHCKACAKHAHAPPPRAFTCLHDFHLVEFSHQPVLSQ